MSERIFAPTLTMKSQRIYPPTLTQASASITQQMVMPSMTAMPRIYLPRLKRKPH